MNLRLPKIFSEGGASGKATRKAAAKASRPPIATQTAVWVGATVVFAVLFFLSAVLDMKVKISFGNQAAATTQSTTGTFNSAPVQSAPAGGIASQVGGC
jgi:hypothetical protein